MAKQFQKCFLHIGTEKTGTTTIQRFLAGNRESLAKEGFLYTLSGGRHGSQRSFEACVHASPWTTDLAVDRGIRSASDQESFRKRFMGLLEKECAEHSECHALIISCEHFHSRLTSRGEIEGLAELLSPYAEAFEILLYLRRQDQVALSHYSTKLKSGALDPALFPGSKDGRVEYYYDYESVYANWAQIFGDDAMRVRIFEKERLAHGDLLLDFSDLCGMGVEGKQVPKNANESLSQGGVDFFRHMNRHVPRNVKGKRNPTHVKLSGVVGRLCAGKAELATRDQAVTFYATYKPGNDRLRARIFPDTAGSLFDEDFSGYPDVLPEHAPDYDDAVRIAIGIFQRSQKDDGAEGTETKIQAARVVPAVDAETVALENPAAIAPKFILERTRRERPMQKKTLYLHIGSDKTGSTAIQAFAFRNAEVLRARGLHVVSSGEPHHGPLCAGLRAGDSSLLRAAVDEMERSEATKFLLTFEGFYRLKSELRESLLTALKPFDLRMVFYVRRRSDKLRSGVAQILKIKTARNGDPACDFLFGGTLPTQFKSADYLSIVRGWQRSLAEIDQPDAFDLRVYEKSSFIGGDLLRDFYERIGAVSDGENLTASPFKGMPEIINRSISPAAQYLMALLFSVGLNDNQRAGVRGLLADLDDAEERSHSLVADDLASAWDERFAEDDAVLAREFFGRDALFQENPKFCYRPPSGDSIVRLIKGVHSLREQLGDVPGEGRRGEGRGVRQRLGKGQNRKQGGQGPGGPGSKAKALRGQSEGRRNNVSGGGL